MPKIDYPNVIRESQQELEKLERRHRYTHLFHRVKMLRLLKSGKCRNLGEAAQELGYSWRQCQRWFTTYKQGGLEKLLSSRVHERGRRELVTQEAWEQLEEAMKGGQIATIGQAHMFLVERGIVYTDPSSVGQLLKRRQAKLKSGRPRHYTRLSQKNRSASKKFAENLRREGQHHLQQKPLKVLAFDEARFGLINWHKRRYCPKGFRPPYIVYRAYEWTYLYTAVDPVTGESFCLYLPGLDGRCFEAFLKHLGEAYADHRLVVVLDNAPSHISKEVVVPQNVSLLALPAYSPELNPVERWFQEFRGALANKFFATIELLQEALTQTLELYWEEPAPLRKLVGFPWWTRVIEAL
jgi:transposase